MIFVFNLLETRERSESSKTWLVGLKLYPNLVGRKHISLWSAMNHILEVGDFVGIREDCLLSKST
jgi:hypothetical protein